MAKSYIQSLTATRDDSSVAKAIEECGEELNHVGYRVTDREAALVAMVAAVPTPIDKEPRRGSHGTLVAFIQPKGSFDTLIEPGQEQHTVLSSLR